MDKDFVFPYLDRSNSSYLVLLSLSALTIVGVILYRIGVLGRVLRALAATVRVTVRGGLRIWEYLFSWASWPWFLTVVLCLLGAGCLANRSLPMAGAVCALALLFMGITACLAYMSIDLERYEVERGYKAVHNPLKGQELARHLIRYGHRVRLPLLAAATFGMVTGFALLNQSLYETIGRKWFSLEEREGLASYADFLAYALINLLRVVDVLNVLNSHHFLEISYVHQAAWPASALLIVFRMFFSFVLLQQLFASLRQGRLLSETITDLWSPHESIHERARNALPQYGPAAIEPLLVSLRNVTSLTKEQREQLPRVLAAVGPTTIPFVIRHLHDPDEHVRTVAASTLGLLHAPGVVPLLVKLAQDTSDMVRQSVVEALGLIAGANATPIRKRLWNPRNWLAPRDFWRFLKFRKRTVPTVPSDPNALAITTLTDALSDKAVVVRTKAIQALGKMGPSAGDAAARLTRLIKEDEDETVRCEAAQSLGKIGVSSGTSLAALIDLLQDESSFVKSAAARTLGTMKNAAASAVPALLPLLQDRDHLVRRTIAEALSQIEHFDGEVEKSLVNGLSHRDSMIRAQTAEAVGIIGMPVRTIAPFLVEAVTDQNDVVRAKAVEALGKFGEAAADVALPSLVQALDDQDNWVSAMAAEALGQMGDSSDEAVSALIRALGHINPNVRANAAEALGTMGKAGATSAAALQNACRDVDAGVRCEALRALTAIDLPTAASRQAVIGGFEDSSPQVRAAAIEATRHWQKADDAMVSGLLKLIDDTNDQVKAQVAKVLPAVAEATPEVIGALCRRLREDDSDWVQVHAAQALGKLRCATEAAQQSLIRACQTGEVSVREEAMRALATIMAPGSASAFAAGLKDASANVRKIASAGLMRATEIPYEMIANLIDSLRDPEAQVRANAAHTLSRLEQLPAETIPLLIESTADANDGLRINATMALQRAPRDVVGGVMRHLLEDSNIRVRLIAANALASNEFPDSEEAIVSVLVDASRDTTTRVRQAVMGLVESLIPRGAAYIDALEDRLQSELEPQARAVVAAILQRLGKHSSHSKSTTIPLGATSY